MGSSSTLVESDTLRTMLLCRIVAQTIPSGSLFNFFSKFFFFLFLFSPPSSAVLLYSMRSRINHVFRIPYFSVRVLVSNSKTNIIGPIGNSGTRFRNDWLTAFVLRKRTRRDSQTVNDNRQQARLVELKPSNRPTVDRRQADKRRV